MQFSAADRQAVILAGGRGTRLRPYTTIFPKPLVPVGEHPILELVIRQLAGHGFRDITLAVGFLAELIMAYFGDGSRWGVRLAYSREEQPLGTAGPLALIKERLHRPFLVMNGDLLTDLNFGDVMRYHVALGGIATVALARRSVQIDFGVVQVDAEYRLTGWSEKPELTYLVSAGIYIFDPAVLTFIPAGQYFDLPQLVMSLVKDGQSVNTYVHEGYWLDIGRPEDLQRANEEFQANHNLRSAAGLEKVDRHDMEL